MYLLVDVLKHCIYNSTRKIKLNLLILFYFKDNMI
jgi:hypothetical protein